MITAFEAIAMRVYGRRVVFGLSGLALISAGVVLVRTCESLLMLPAALLVPIGTTLLVASTIASWFHPERGQYRLSNAPIRWILAAIVAFLFFSGVIYFPVKVLAGKPVASLTSRSTGPVSDVARASVAGENVRRPRASGAIGDR